MSRTRPYVVRRGDHLDGIAAAHGVSSDALWDDPANAALRSRRDPALLHPGDVLHVPAAPAEPLPVRAHATNTFRARAPAVTVRVAVLDAAEAPLAGRAFTARAGGRERGGTTDAEGTAVFAVPAWARRASLEVAGDEGEEPLRLDVEIGALDPADERSGAAQRLANLGRGGLPLEEALQRFQAARGLPVTGALDEATREALRRAHGS